MELLKPDVTCFGIVHFLECRTERKQKWGDFKQESTQVSTLWKKQTSIRHYLVKCLPNCRTTITHVDQRRLRIEWNRRRRTLKKWSSNHSCSWTRNQNKLYTSTMTGPTKRKDHVSEMNVTRLSGNPAVTQCNSGHIQQEMTFPPLAHNTMHREAMS